jgi:hypothetical protein
LVLRKAKVISYKDLKEAQAKYTEKEAAKEAKDKGKRGQKCKSAMPEADKVTIDKGKRGRKRKSAMPEVDTLKLKAKVARISNALE